MVGFWPLDSKYGGADLSGNKNHMMLHEIIQHPNEVEFLAPAESYGEIRPSPSLDVKRKFSWFCAMTIANLVDGAVFEWYGGVHIWVLGAQLYMNLLREGDCSGQVLKFGTLAAGQFYNLAVSVDVTNSEANIWINEDKKTFSTLTTCDKDLRTSGAVTVGIR